MEGEAIGRRLEELPSDLLRIILRNVNDRIILFDNRIAVLVGQRDENLVPLSTAEARLEQIDGQLRAMLRPGYRVMSGFSLERRVMDRERSDLINRIAALNGTIVGYNRMIARETTIRNHWITQAQGISQILRERSNRILPQVRRRD